MARVPAPLRTLGCGALAVIALAVAPTARAEQPAEKRAQTRSEGRDEGSFRRRGGKPITWDPAWTRFGAANWALAGTSLVATGIALAAGPDENNPRRGPILADEGVRDALRLSTKRARQGARETSDVLLAVNLAFPMLIDSLAVAGWYRDSPEVAVDMALITSEALAVSAGLWMLTSVAVSRERPYADECGETISEETQECVGQRRYRSFFSGHATLSFAAASVTCVHHAKMPLYGGGAADAVPCIAGYGLATATAALRVMGDQHYFTDVAAGALAGTVSGLAVPLLLHYHPSTTTAHASAGVRIVPTGNGLGLAGWF